MLELSGETDGRTKDRTHSKRDWNWLPFTDYFRTFEVLEEKSTKAKKHPHKKSESLNRLLLRIRCC